MNEHLRDRILRRLDTLSDERGYQVLDYVEFLESKYAEKQAAAPAQSPFTRFAEAVEDKMRAGKMSAQTITETMGLLNRAVGILNGAAAAGKTVVDDLVNTVNAVAASPAGPPPGPTSGGASGQGTGPASGGGSATPPSPSPQGEGPEGATGSTTPEGGTTP